jgi:hypothetical protein
MLVSTGTDSVRLEWRGYTLLPGSKSGTRSRCAALWRPFLAPSVVRRGPSAWGLVSGPLKPPSQAGFGLAMLNPSLTSGAPQGISILLAGAPRCRSGRHVLVRSPLISPNRTISRLLRPQSPFPRLSEVWHVWLMRERRARWRSGHSFPSTFTKTENVLAPRACVLFCFRAPVGAGIPPWGPPPYPGPAVHRDDGWTALHWAAKYGNRRIVRLLIAFKADVNAQHRFNGCAVSASASAGAATESPLSAVQAHAAARGSVQWPIPQYRRTADARRRRGRPER